MVTTFVLLTFAALQLRAAADVNSTAVPAPAIATPATVLRSAAHLSDSLANQATAGAVRAEDIRALRATLSDAQTDVNLLRGRCEMDARELRTRTAFQRLDQEIQQAVGGAAQLEQATMRGAPATRDDQLRARQVSLRLAAAAALADRIDHDTR